LIVHFPLISLQTNIAHYAAAILLSTKLSAYKGSVAKNILLVGFLGLPVHSLTSAS
jgi:hypothetical protein